LSDNGKPFSKEDKYYAINPYFSCAMYFTNFQTFPSTPLNGSLRNFNTWRVSVSNRTLRRAFWVSAPKRIWGPKTTYFRRLYNSVATL